MKIIAICPKCGKKLITSYEGCIAGGTAVHSCNDSENKNFEVIEGIKWKITEK